jgi:outer membrane protein OmpA-like peptidoglycan-associated protein
MQSGGNLQAFQPDATLTNPCPNETGWLLSTLPLTNSDKKGESLSSNPGSAFLPEDMQRELVNIAAKENISLNELCGKLNRYKTRLEEYGGDPQEYNRQRMLILEEMLDCRKSCGKILNKFAALYTESSRIYFSGIVRFNFGARKVDSSFKGDKTHGSILINNEEQLKAALARWQKDPSQRIQLDARSSIPGSTDINDRISKIRAEAVLGWLTAHGVPATQISIRWLGKYGPLIDKTVARAYNIENIFNEYVDNKANQSTSLIGSQGFNSFFDGLNQSVCIFVLP